MAPETGRFPAKRMGKGLTGGYRVSRPEHPRVIAVIPVYNHGATLREVTAGCLKVLDRVMVVDDGSTDGGPDTLRGLGVEIVRHPRNLGKGAAILTAAAKARKLSMTHIVTLDADGQHDPEEIRLFVREIASHPRAIIVGRRDFGSACVPGSSRLGREISNFWLRTETGVTLGDAQSGFRAYPVEIFEELKLRERGYALEIEVLVRAAWAGVELREVDISIFYPPPGERISHFRMFRDNLRLSILNTRLVMRALLSLPHRKIKGLRWPGR